MTQAKIRAEVWRKRLRILRGKEKVSDKVRVAVADESEGAVALWPTCAVGECVAQTDLDLNLVLGCSQGAFELGEEFDADICAKQYDAAQKTLVKIERVINTLAMPDDKS